MDGGRVALLCGTRREGTNAILEYTRCLDRALRDHGTASEIVEIAEAPPDLKAYDAVVLQYNPFLYGRWGFAPLLVASLLRVRMSTRRPTLAIMVHEMYVPMRDWRSIIMGVVQRIQLRLLHALSDLVFVSIENWTDTVSGWAPRRPTWHLPVGSNLPDCGRERGVARDQLGVDDGTLVLASLGTGHPSRLTDYVVAATNAVALHHAPVLMLNLGAGAPSLKGLNPAVSVVEPGPLASDDLARLLSAADLFLAPFVDGVSTRRGSVMAALQHALPVVGTEGHLTDACLRESGALRLVPAAQIATFANVASSLVQDQTRRVALAAAAGALYQREFDWPVIAARLREHLDATVCAGRGSVTWEPA
jgi:glycosyltransferase involved in cell wall biosynthesis